MSVPPFLAAAQSRMAPPAGPAGGMPPGPDQGMPDAPAGGLTEEIVKHLQMVNSLMDQLIQSGEPLDPNLLGPELQSFGQQLAILSSQGQGQQQPPPPGGMPMGGGMPPSPSPMMGA